MDPLPHAYWTHCELERIFTSTDIATTLYNCAPFVMNSVQRHTLERAGREAPAGSVRTSLFVMRTGLHPKNARTHFGSRVGDPLLL